MKTKTILLTLLCFVGLSTATAQSDVWVWKGGSAVKTEMADSITFTAPAPARDMYKATTEDIGKTIGEDGKIYNNKKHAKAAGTTAVAMIAYVGSETDNATYKHGLAIALTDESGTMKWSTAKSTCESKNTLPVAGAAWLLPSQNQWKVMFKANGGNEGSYTGLNSAITTAGGTVLQEYRYWSSSEYDGDRAWRVILYGDVAYWDDFYKFYDFRVRSCLAF